MATVLHITLCQRIVAKHRNMRKCTVVATRDTIERLALSANTSENREDLALRGHLERSTGLPIAALAEIAKQWPEL